MYKIMLVFFMMMLQTVLAIAPYGTVEFKKELYESYLFYRDYSSNNTDKLSVNEVWQKYDEKFNQDLRAFLSKEYLEKEYFVITLPKQLMGPQVTIQAICAWSKKFFSRALNTYSPVTDAEHCIRIDKIKKFFTLFLSEKYEYKKNTSGLYGFVMQGHGHCVDRANLRQSLLRAAGFQVYISVISSQQAKKIDAFSDPVEGITDDSGHAFNIESVIDWNSDTKKYFWRLACGEVGKIGESRMYNTLYVPLINNHVVLKEVEWLHNAGYQEVADLNDGFARSIIYSSYGARLHGIDINKALAFYRQAYDVCPNYYAAKHNLSVMLSAKISNLFSQKEYDGCVSFLNELKKFNNDSVTKHNLYVCYYNLGVRHKQATQYQKAYDFFKQAYVYKKDPEIKVLVYDMFIIQGYTCFSRQEFDAAIRYYKRAIKVHAITEGDKQDLGLIYFSRGKMYEKKKKYGLAIRDYERSYAHLTGEIKEKIKAVIAVLVFEGAVIMHNKRVQFGKKEDKRSQELYQKALTYEKKYITLVKKYKPELYSDMFESDKIIE